MGISRDLVIKKFLAGESCSRGNIYTDGETIFSYGDHWPLAIRLKGGSYLFNQDYYGGGGWSSTPIHSRDVQQALQHATVTRASCKDMRRYLTTYPRPDAVILYQREVPDSVEKIVDDIESLYRSSIGRHERFPHQKIQNMISDEMLWHRYKNDSYHSSSYYLSKMLAHKFDPMFKIVCAQARKGISEATEAVAASLHRSLVKKQQFFAGSRALAKGVPGFRGAIKPHVGAVYLLIGDPIVIAPCVTGDNNPKATPVLMGQYLNMKTTITTVSESDAKKMVTNAVLENL